MFEAADGLGQTIWRLDDAALTATVAERLADRPLYLIDGHHRAAAAWDHYNISDSPEAKWMLTAVFPSDQLVNHPYHRWLRPPLKAEEFLDLLVSTFPVDTVETFGSVPNRRADQLAIYVDNRWHLVQVPLRSMGTSVHSRLDNLDPVLLQSHILGPLLGIDAAAPGDRLAYRPDVTGRAELQALVDREGGALCYMRAASVDVLLDASDAGSVMPPKSTYFAPKARSGLFLRPTIG
jgi:uncharacterized protein (DUF1015 family)